MTQLLKMVTIQHTVNCWRGATAKATDLKFCARLGPRSDDKLSRKWGPRDATISTDSLLCISEGFLYESEDYSQENSLC